MRNFHVLIGAVLVASCSSGPGAPPALETDQRYATESLAGANLTELQKSEIERVVAAKLPDPASARFDFMNAVHGESGLLKVCGWVNHKNYLGRWEGFRPFYASYLPTSETAVLNGLATSTDGIRLVKAQCRDGGVPLSQQATSG